MQGKLSSILSYLHALCCRLWVIRSFSSRVHFVQVTFIVIIMCNITKILQIASLDVLLILQHSLTRSDATRTSVVFWRSAQNFRPICEHRYVADDTECDDSNPASNVGHTAAFFSACATAENECQTTLSFPVVDSIRFALCWMYATVHTETGRNLQELCAHQQKAFVGAKVETRTTASVMDIYLHIFVA